MSADAVATLLGILISWLDLRFPRKGSNTNAGLNMSGGNGTLNGSGNNKNRLAFPLLQAGKNPFGGLASAISMWVRDQLDTFVDMAGKKMNKAEDVQDISRECESNHFDGAQEKVSKIETERARSPLDIRCQHRDVRTKD